VPKSVRVWLGKIDDLVHEDAIIFKVDPSQNPKEYADSMVVNGYPLSHRIGYPLGKGLLFSLLWDMEVPYLEEVLRRIPVKDLESHLDVITFIDSLSWRDLPLRDDLLDGIELIIQAGFDIGLPLPSTPRITALEKLFDVFPCRRLFEFIFEKQLPSTLNLEECNLAVSAADVTPFDLTRRRHPNHPFFWEHSLFNPLCGGDETIVRLLQFLLNCEQRGKFNPYLVFVLILWFTDSIVESVGQRESEIFGSTGIRISTWRSKFTLRGVQACALVCSIQPSRILVD
jgi:hypothetical protein